MSRSPVDPLDPLASLTRARAERADARENADVGGDGNAREDAEDGVTGTSVARVSSPALGADPLLGDLPEGVTSETEIAAEAGLGDEDRDLLVALAAFQLRYGEAAEALAYLVAARVIFPGDAEITRLTADALIALDRVDEAEEVLGEMSPAARRRSPLAALSLALVRLAQGRSGEARRLFLQYRDARETGLPTGEAGARTAHDAAERRGPGTADPAYSPNPYSPNPYSPGASRQQD